MRKPITIHNDAFLLLLLVYKGASVDPGKLREWLGVGVGGPWMGPPSDTFTVVHLLYRP